MEILNDVLILLTALVVGVALGASASGLVSDALNISLLAEFSVVFLLFTLGLEFSLPQLRTMRWTVFGLGNAQVLVTSVTVPLRMQAAPIQK